MSMHRDERLANGKKIKLSDEKLSDFTEEDIEDLFWAASLSIIASYAQMFQCLRQLDKEFGFGLNLPATIATFRAGCILQGYMLQPMTKAFEDDPNISSLLVAFKPELEENMERYSRLMSNVALGAGSATPVLSASF